MEQDWSQTGLMEQENEKAATGTHPASTASTDVTTTHTHRHHLRLHPHQIVYRISCMASQDIAKNGLNETKMQNQT